MSDADPDSAKFPFLTPTEAARELGIGLTQRRQPNLRDKVPKRHVSKAEAKARGWSMFFDGSTICRYGHNAARYTSNPNRCSDCDRVKAGEEPIYGKSRTQKYYPEPRRKPKDQSAPVVIAAPAVPASAPELPKRETDFLAALDEQRDFDRASTASSWSRGLIEARASSNEPFRKALTDLCERRGIAWTRAPDSIFTWSEEVEKNLVRRFVDTGLLETARNECGVTASDFFIHLDRSPSFAAAIEAARPRARETLRDRATQAASVGKIDLLKFLESTIAEDSIGNLTPDQMNAELWRLLERFDKQGLLTATKPAPSNADLVGA